MSENDTFDGIDIKSYVRGYESLSARVAKLEAVLRESNPTIICCEPHELETVAAIARAALRQLRALSPPEDKP